MFADNRDTTAAGDTLGEDPNREMVSDVRASSHTHSNEDCQRESTPSLVRNNNNSSSEYIPADYICILFVYLAYGAMTATDGAHCGISMVFSEPPKQLLFFQAYLYTYIQYFSANSLLIFPSFVQGLQLLLNGSTVAHEDYLGKGKVLSFAHCAACTVCVRHQSPWV